jgi:hypothetical protein
VDAVNHGRDFSAIPPDLLSCYSTG